MPVYADQLYYDMFQEANPAKRRTPFAEATSHTEALLKSHSLREVVDSLPSIMPLYRPKEEWEGRFWPIISADKNCTLLLDSAGCSQLPKQHEGSVRYGATQTASWRHSDGGVNHNVQVDIARAITHYDNFSLATTPEWVLSLRFPDALLPFTVHRETSFPASSELRIGYGKKLQRANLGQEVVVNSILEWLVGTEKTDIVTDIDVFAIK